MMSKSWMCRSRKIPPDPGQIALVRRCRIVARNANGVNAAEHIVTYGLARRAITRVEATLESHLDGRSTGANELHDFHCRVEVECDRLFAEGGQRCLDRLAHHRRVRVCGRSDDHGIHGSQEIVDSIGNLRSELGRHLLGARAVRVDEHDRRRRPDGPAPLARDTARSAPLQ